VNESYELNPILRKELERKGLDLDSAVRGTRQRIMLWLNDDRIERAFKVTAGGLDAFISVLREKEEILRQELREDGIEFGWFEDDPDNPNDPDWVRMGFAFFRVTPETDNELGWRVQKEFDAARAEESMAKSRLEFAIKAVEEMTGKTVVLVPSTVEEKKAAGIWTADTIIKHLMPPQPKRKPK
jgi:hypothetical protein